jgi:hypothetical protein
MSAATKLLLLLSVLSTCHGDNLPKYMLGDYKMQTSKGFNDYMYELGVNWFTRTIANNLYPLQKIRQTADGQISLDTETTFRSTYTKFRLGQTWKVAI